MKHYLVVDNVMNRAWAPELIGKRFFSPPSYVGVKIIDGCPHDPTIYKGLPIGMYHCPICGEMVLAGLAH